MDERMAARVVTTPVGELVLGAERGAIVLAKWVSALDDRGAEARAAPDPALDEAERQVEAYFCGRRRAFDLPIVLDGTPFQARVWARLREIPFGETIAYAELARRVGDARAARAVGTANGQNPVALFVPCHRVIGRDGALRGYAGGVEVKAALLAHEARIAGRAWRPRAAPVDAAP